RRHELRQGLRERRAKDAAQNPATTERRPRDTHAAASRIRGTFVNLSVRDTFQVNMRAIRQSLSKPGARIIVGAVGGVIIVAALIVGLILVPSGSGSPAVQLLASESPSPSASPTQPPPPPKVASPINGVMLDRAAFD